MAFDCDKIILKYSVFKINLKKKRKNAARVELGAFGSVIRCVTNGATRDRTHTFGIFYLYTEEK